MITIAVLVCVLGAGRASVHVARAGDMDLDGCPDLLLAAPYDDGGGAEAGAAWGLSGKDFSVIFARYGEEPDHRLGTALAASIAANGVTSRLAISSDGPPRGGASTSTGRVLVGVPEAGAFEPIQVILGMDADGTRIDGFGRSVEFDADARTIQIGCDGGKVWTAGTGDVTAVLHSSPVNVAGARHVATAWLRGALERVDVFERKDELQVQSGPTDKPRFASALATQPLMLGSGFSCKVDVDRSGEPPGPRNVVLGLSPFALGHVGGVAWLELGGSREPRKITASAFSAPKGIQLGAPSFGCAVRFVDDLDGDQVPELLIGAPGSKRPMTRAELEAIGFTDPASMGEWMCGLAFLVSGRQLNILDTIHPPADADGSFGSVIERVGDLDGDGADEYAILSGHWFYGGYDEFPVDMVVYSPKRIRTLAHVRVANGQAPRRVR